MVAGSKKSCGCPSSCSCDKTPAKALSDLKGVAAQGKLDDSPEFKALVEKAPETAAKMWGPAKRKYGTKAVAKKSSCGSKRY